MTVPAPEETLAFVPTLTAERFAWQNDVSLLSPSDAFARCPIEQRSVLLINTEKQLRSPSELPTVDVAHRALPNQQLGEMFLPLADLIASFDQELPLSHTFSCELDTRTLASF